MNLSIDIGNTSISLGFFKENRLLKRACLFTKSNKYFPFLKKYFNKYKIEKVIISSVVPWATKEMERALRRLKAENILILGKNLVVPIKNRYQCPKEVGQDRLVNAFAAVNLYGYPAIVVDFGTAVTFDVISKNKEYLGGMILPGLETSLNSLHEKTALLPKVKLSSAPRDLFGRNTRNSMLSGVIFGFASLTDGVIGRFKHKLGKNTLAIGTGGNIKFISRYCRQFSSVDIDLTLKGLNLILSTC
jgi:type III pantothenate kinase